MRSINRKVVLAVGAAIASVGLFGAVAFAAFAPDVSTTTNSVFGPSNVVAAEDTKHDRFKDVLDGLVKKGVITQAQEDAILAALKDAAGTHVKVEAILHDFFSESAKYLGMTDKDLHAKLPGTSLAAIANATPGKSRNGLVADLVTFGNTHIDKALAEARRVLKTGGRFLCLEFSACDVPLLDRLYDFHSFEVIPRLGQLAAGAAEPYRYLVESIRRFPAQEALAARIAAAGLGQVKVRNLSGGIAALHSAWRI
jgi:SAM-dependent methyltransferase